MRITRVLTVLCMLALSVPAAELAAQQPASGRRVQDSIPRSYQPPAGMCRIWLDGVPAVQQPAPVDCSIAVRNKPPNGRVVYGPKKPGANDKGLSSSPIRRLDERPSSPPVRVPGRPGRPGGEREPWENRRIDDEQLFGDRQQRLPVASSGGQNQPAALGPGAEAYVGQSGLIVGMGGVTDPRYFSPGTTPPGRGSSSCLDRDGDGWCDDFRFGPPPCLDRDKDGRCDDLPAFASLPYPQILPLMKSVVDVVQGTPSVEVAQWLGTNEFVARLPDQGRGSPWRAIFLDANTNQLMQVWTDRDKDGRVDRVEIFRNGQRVKLIQR